MSGFARFVTLYEALDRTTATTAKREALEAYFGGAPPRDLAWAVFFLTGRRLRRLVAARDLRAWAAAHTGLPPWLIEECYHTVGDLAETLAILCARGGGGELDGTAAADLFEPAESDAGGPPQLEVTSGSDDHPNHSVPAPILSAALADFVEQRLAPLSAMRPDAQRREIIAWWDELGERECFIAHKLVTGAFRVGVSATLVAKALATVAGRDAATIEHRLMGNWQPDDAFALHLLAEDDAASDQSRPYPFFLATPLDADPSTLGEPSDWLAEWKWDGIRAQLIVRGGAVFLWSRGEELVTDRFPEITSAARALPDGTVLDGEIVIWRDGRALPFTALQTRIGRRNVDARVLRETPAVMLVFDQLEHAGQDLRDEPLSVRRQSLEALLSGGNGILRPSPRVVAESWESLLELRTESRQRGVEGLMLKRWSSPYRVGRPRGDWWKWKVAPYTIDAVLIYSQPGHGRRAALYTDHTFAVRDGDSLVPVAKAYSGLSDEENRRLDTWIRTHTLERFGPVRAVEPVHVFELGFEAVQRSTRHKSGIAVRFPRILRWRTDKGPQDADTLSDLQAMIGSAESGNPEPRRSGHATDATLSLFDIQES
jgi:DNA ligase-1